LHINGLIFPHLARGECLGSRSGPFIIHSTFRIPLPFDPLSEALFDARAEMLQWLLQRPNCTNPKILRALLTAVGNIQLDSIVPSLKASIEDRHKCAKLLLEHLHPQSISPDDAQVISDLVSNVPALRKLAAQILCAAMTQNRPNP